MLGCLGLIACEASPTTRECAPELIELSALAPLEPAEDPFDDRPAEAVCDTTALHVEDFGGEPAYSVPTGDCGYVSARAPLLRDLAVGDTVSVRVWHFALIASVSSAHVSVRLGTQSALDQRVPIPSASGLITSEWTVNEALAAGEPVTFHLHNHGANAWSLLEVARTGCAD